MTGAQVRRRASSSRAFVIRTARLLFQRWAAGRHQKPGRSIEGSRLPTQPNGVHCGNSTWMQSVTRYAH